MSQEMGAKQPDTFAIRDERSQGNTPVNSPVRASMRFSQVICRKGWRMDNPGAILYHKLTNLEHLHLICWKFAHKSDTNSSPMLPVPA